MITLLTDTANQTIRMTLDEGRAYFDDTFTHYLLILTREEKSDVGQDLAQVVTVSLENQRYTQLIVTTVGLDGAGQYRYFVYGQNSSSNLDPNNAAVVGIVEQGWLNLTSNSDYFAEITSATQDDLQYAG